MRFAPFLMLAAGFFLSGCDIGTRFYGAQRYGYYNDPYAYRYPPAAYYGGTAFGWNSYSAPRYYHHHHTSPVAPAVSPPPVAAPARPPAPPAATQAEGRRALEQLGFRPNS
jgi:hypothetical protein